MINEYITMQIAISYRYILLATHANLTIVICNNIRLCTIYHFLFVIFTVLCETQSYCSFQILYNYISGKIIISSKWNTEINKNFLISLMNHVLYFESWHYMTLYGKYFCLHHVRQLSFGSTFGVPPNRPSLNCPKKVNFIEGQNR